MFEPRPAYDVVFETIQLREFTEYWDEFVVRPPYQRKTVWSRGKQQALLDSLFRSYYVPRIVIREVRLSERQIIREVIDGQQRITTAKRFREDELPLPKSLSDLDQDLVGKRYSELPADVRRFVDRLSFAADVVKGIDDPRDADHQQVASDIFWRLQQGIPLNYMETAHARLASLARNFIAKYADDISFDYESYKPLDINPSKHPFFSVINRSNDRMQHLALLARFLLLEKADGPADLQETNVTELIEESQDPKGVDNLDYEQTSEAQGALRTMNVFFETFKNDPLVVQGEGMKELSVEYLIVSVYLLLRHLLTYYVFAEAEQTLFRDFLVDFYGKWAARSEADPDVIRFAEARQQNGNEIEIRDRILRQLFFDFSRQHGHTMLDKDNRRAFDEAERIAIYRRDEGLCQICIEEGKPEAEARVPWREFDADHVLPHSRGGQTVVDNGRVLCRYHNRGRPIADPGAGVPA
ncbi:MAG TPA: DUF262 domain-containing protein [Solirubrobacterales bacterium]|nr:DUF262 domain-containing protein [Solirubrobacterales bacterium]